MIGNELPENLLCKSASEVLSGLDVFGALDRDAVEDLEFLEKIKDVKSIAFLL